MAVKVQCRNKLCEEFGKPCDIPDSLGMAPGELIYCGGCGYETRWIGADRPKINKEFNSNSMNRTGNSGNYEEG